MIQGLVEPRRVHLAGMEAAQARERVHGGEHPLLLEENIGIFQWSGSTVSPDGHATPHDVRNALFIEDPAGLGEHGELRALVGLMILRCFQQIHNGPPRLDSIVLGRSFGPAPRLFSSMSTMTPVSSDVYHYR
ncbi:hypothetical protein D3C72_752990 [compost metagenome]